MLELDAIYLDLAGSLLYKTLKGLVVAKSVQPPYRELRGRRPEVCDIV